MYQNLVNLPFLRWGQLGGCWVAFRNGCEDSDCKQLSCGFEHPPVIFVKVFTSVESNHSNCLVTIDDWSNER